MRRTAVLFVLSCGLLSAQSADPDLRFDAAVVRPATPGTRGAVRGGPGTSDPAELNWVISLQGLLMRAYAVNLDQVSAPDWTLSTNYEVLAKIPAGATQNQFEQMLQNLLAERFHLAVHRETKVFPVFNLSVGKKEPKLKVSEYVPPPKPDLGPGQQWIGGVPVWMTGSGGYRTVHGRAATASDLVKAVSFGVHARVVDKTGLTGKYDFSFAFNSSDSPGAGAAAVRDQLGLELEETKTTLPVIVVDHVDRVPTAN